MKNILTNWKTSLIGLIIVGGLAYKGFTVGFSIVDALLGFGAIGFFTGKDGDKSHTKDFKADTGGHPDPDKEEK